jgi:glycosyltransferase involved in cell wall biosynthesis
VQESLALGVPVIASDVPSYRGWVEHGVTGLLVRPSTAAWVDAMRAMQDPGRRAEMAEAGRAAAKAWTIDATIGKWLDVYRSLLPEGS